MQNKDTNISFVRVYYENKNDLQIQFGEYIILFLMEKSSQGNIYKSGITYLHKQTGFSRTTIYKYIKKLKMLNHIIEEKNNRKTIYLLNSDIKERLEYEREKFVIVYSDWKTFGVKKISHYIFYYIMFVLSRKRKFANASHEYYASIIGIKPKTIYTVIKDDFVIKKPSTNYMKLTDEKEKWFLNRQNVQFLESNL